MENKKTNTVAESLSLKSPTKSSKMSSLEYTAPHISIYEESNAPDAWCMHDESGPTTPVAPTSSLSTASTSASREPGSGPSTTPTSPRLHPTKPQTCPPDASTNAWEEDLDLFPQYSWLYPSSPNGTWLSSALQSPSTALSSIDGTQIRNALSEVGDAVSDRLTHALDGKDLPAMHDRALSYLAPSVSMPSLRRVGRGVDRVAEGEQGSFGRGRGMGRGRRDSISTAATASAAISEDGEEGRDQLTFAATMASRALDELVEKGIVKDRIDAARVCEKRLEAALTLLFIFAIDEGGYDAETLFATTPVWVADADDDVKDWQLKLDTGFVNVVAVDGEDFVEEQVQLDVHFTLEQ